MTTAEVVATLRQSELGSLADSSADEFMSRVGPVLDKMTSLGARLAGSQNASDIVQAALEHAWSKRRQFDPHRGSLSAWLLAITAHEAFRTRKRERVMVVDAASSVEPSSDDRLAVEDAVQRLSPRQRLAVDCYYFADLTITETAEVMKCSIGTVKSSLSDARKRIRARIEGDPTHER